MNALAIQDDLTGVYKRRHFMAVVQAGWGRAQRYNTPAALLLIDADHFKHINDRHGHLCGDELLRRRVHRVPAPHRPAGRARRG